MDRESVKGLRAFLTVIVIFALVVSVFLSLRGFTGYIVSEEINVVNNTFALVLFVVGVIGAWFVFGRK